MLPLLRQVAAAAAMLLLLLLMAVMVMMTLASLFGVRLQLSGRSRTSFLGPS